MLNNCITYIPNVFKEINFETLDNEIEWEQHTCKILGKSIPLPRLTKFYSALEGKKYNYTGTHNQGYNFEFSSTLKQIFKEISDNYLVNVCLLNRYKNGNDYIGFHSDDEKEGVSNSTIVSLSFGASRTMQFRKKKGKHPIEKEVILNHGDLLLMHPGCQDKYKHAIPKRRKILAPRINLTFRLFK